MSDEMPAEEAPATFGDQVQAYLAEHGVVVKWLLIADIMPGEGERYIVTDSTADMPPWDIIGMMDHIKEGMQAAHTVAVIQSAGGEEEA